MGEIRNSPAYPMPIAANGAGDVVNTGDYLHPDWWGLTKREAFAMAAMQGLLANSYGDGMNQPLSTASHDEIARMSVEQADALLAELAKDPT